MRGVVGGGGCGTQVGQKFWVNGAGGGLFGCIDRQLVAENSISASQVNHSADQFRAGKRETFGMMVKSPIVWPATACGPLSGEVTNGKSTRSAKYQPLLILVAFPAPPALAELPSLPSLPSKMPVMSLPTNSVVDAQSGMPPRRSLSANRSRMSPRSGVRARNSETR